ncbi:putative late blight resistance protein homolog R1A-3 [Coffea arabica]|uniref:Late blight resistance protein homolog R1A-3 n=1 Tax=Coffea arabica TaxID=13443 RepID=A0A6P6TFS0_COFAR|nr:putative late blight resistance protein homolog R1A-3 [Coffea arabica]
MAVSRFDYALFGAALHDLESIESWFRREREYPEYRGLWKMRMELKLLRTFYTCAREWGSKYGFLEHEQDKHASPRVILMTIEDLVCKISNEAHSLCLASDHDYSLVLNMISGFRTTVRAMKRDVVKLSFMFSANSLEYRLVDMIPIVITNFLENLMDLLCCVNDEALLQLIEALVDKLKFFNNFIRFTRTQGVDFMQSKDLYSHVEFVAVKAARLIFMWGFYFRNDGELLAQVQLEKTQLLEKIKLVDPHIGQICVQLLTAAKLSGSSIILTSKKNGDIAAEFIDSLLCRLWGLFDYDSSFMISPKDQIQRLYEGLRFLRTILLQQYKVKELLDKIQYHLRLVVIDAGTIVCSISRNELKEGLAKEKDLLLFDLLKLIKYIKSRVAQEYLLTSSSSFPTTNELGFLDSLQEKLEQLSKCEADSVAFPKDCIHIFLENLLILRSFLNNIVHQRNQNVKLQTLWSRVMEVAYKAEIIIDYVAVGDRPDCYPMSFDAINEDINFIKTEALEIYDRMQPDIGGQKTTNSYSHMPSQVSTPILDEVVVGLDDEAETVIERLTRGTRQLDVVPIVGMAGQGKTTLAKRVYNDQLIMCHFHVRAWCCVSQGYQRLSLLLKILSDIMDKLPSQYLQMNEDDLAVVLYKQLKGNRYLIVLDDIWGIEAWNGMERSFPNDANGSRVLCTSRLHNLSSEFKQDCKAHPLRLLTDEESWALLQHKLFAKKACPPQLCALGKQIAESCKGLPLAVVVVAGFLATIQQYRWEEVARSLSSSVLSDNELCMNTFELSYRHLPDYLKPCFLYFGAFQEDQEIPIQRLALLWISEGFVQKTGAKSLEDAANEYLMDLIDRSLVMVSQQRSIGGVKTCQIHDLLHEFVIRKAKEESFLHILRGYDELYTFTAPYNPYRLGIYADAMAFKKSRLFCPHLRCLLFFSKTPFALEQKHDFSFMFRIFKLLKVLDLGDYDLGQSFPLEVVLLVHLRYLVIQCSVKSIPSAICKLSRLETFQLKGATTCVALPNTIWMMKELRHLSIASSRCSFGFIFPTDDLERYPDLSQLGSCILVIDCCNGQSFAKILAKLPNIRRLKCVYASKEDIPVHCHKEIVLDRLSRLQSLRMARFWAFKLDFPVNLRKLTLSSNKQQWSEISEIAKLPNLEVLKLLNRSFVGKEWEVTEGAFPKLRFLKLEDLEIVRWTASGDDFPPLEKLVLCSCRMLEEVPSCLGDIPTIEMIEIRSCHKSAVNSVKQIQEEQMDLGNKGLKVVIH